MQRKEKQRQSKTTTATSTTYPSPEQEEQYEDGNNYYQSEDYRGSNRGCRSYRGQYNSRRPYRGSQQREGGNKIITEANFKATTDSLILLVVAITIITMVIIEAEVAMAMVVTFIDHMVTEEATTEAITIINIINITCMMMELSLNNMV